jgi:hypothetical protein
MRDTIRGIPFHLTASSPTFRDAAVACDLLTAVPPLAPMILHSLTSSEALQQAARRGEPDLRETFKRFTAFLSWRALRANSFNRNARQEKTVLLQSRFALRYVQFG